MEEFDEAQHIEQNPDVAALLNKELAEHKGTGFLTPKALAISKFPVKHIALVGSCFLENWYFHRANPDGAQCDLFLADQLGGLPIRSNSDLAAYDFQVVQIPLRAIMTDDLLWSIHQDDEIQLQNTFRACCSRMEHFLSGQMAWNIQTGLLTFVANFGVPQRNSRGHLFRRYHLSNPQFFIERLNEKLEEYVKSYRNAYILDIDNIATSIGRRYVQDDVMSVNSHGGLMPPPGAGIERTEPIATFSDYYDLSGLQPFLDSLWHEMAAMYRAVRQVDSVKLIVIDLDDTLWRGISGEWGEDIDGIVTEGWPIGLVEALMYLKARGILLAIISKNEESRIREIWPRIFSSKLKLDDFAVVKINWLPKTDNMAEILEGTNLLPRNVVYRR